ncbi:MAG: DUF5606 domain-containing protein [Chloroflexota bacterium]
MVLKDILAISGEQGLFRFLAQGKNALIVEHLETKKRSSAHGSAKVSSLEDIAIFTEKEDMPLSKVFDLIHEKENGGPAPDSKADPAKLTQWFENVLPEYSKNKVYASDIRKVAQWYNILHKLGLLIKEEPEKEETAEKDETVSEAGNKDATDEKKVEAAEPAPKKKKKQSPKSEA